MTMQAGTMKQLAIFIAGIALGAAGAVVGFFVGDYLAWPAGKRR
jgi:hypothetical protein